MEWFQTPQRGGRPITPDGGLMEAEVASYGDDGLYVVIPSFDPDRRWGPCPFTRATAPQRGDRCLVAFSSSSPPQLWVIAFAAGVEPPTP